MSNHHHNFSKRLKSNRQVDVANSYVSGGFICDLSVKFNAHKLPLNDDICYTESGTRNHKQTTPMICKDLRKYVRRFMRGLSKQELSNYIVQLLLDCPQESPMSESIRCCHLGGCSLHSSPKGTPPTLSHSQNLPSKQNRHSSLDIRNNPSNDQHNMFVNENMEASNRINQNQSRGTQDQSYFNDIISAIDLLCDMRTLFNQALQSQEKNMGEAPHIEKKVAYSTDKKSRPRFAGYERFEECAVTKCNKRVQTEASSMHYKPDNNICHHLCQGQGSEHTSTSRGLEYQANSYDRFMNHFCQHQTPSPLIPPRANLETYKKYIPVD